MLTSILIAIGLNFDTFSVAIVEGSQVQKPSIIKSLKVGILFGLGQALMALFGSLLGIGFKHVILNADHWIAFILLGFVGSKLITDSKKETKIAEHRHVINTKSLLLLVIATSIDALVIGVTFVFVNGSIFFDVISIGFITFIVSIVGYHLGNSLKKLFKKNIKIIGGFILIAIGLRILIQHLFFGS